RQVHLEGCAVAPLTVDPDMPLALLYDAVDGREPKSGPLAGFFGGEERLEDPLLRGLVHPTTGIADREHDVRALWQVDVALRVRLVQIHAGRLDRESAAVRHRIAGVEREVDDYLAQ